jgi:hypothetical protein
MPSPDLVLSVRQISQFPTKQLASADDLVLVQNGGIGGPYETVPAYGITQGALETGGPYALGAVPPADAPGGQLFSDLLITGDEFFFNAYIGAGGIPRYWQSGSAAAISINGGIGLNYAFAGAAGDAISWTQLLNIDTLGNLTQPAGATVVLGRDPINLLDAATMGWTQTYVLDTIQAILEEDFEVGDVFGFVRMDGSTPMTGPLTLSGWAQQPMQAVPLQQAQTMGGAWVDSVPPPNPWPGRFWLDSTIWQTFVWTGSEWIIAVNWTTAPPEPTTGNWDGGTQWDDGTQWS